MEQKNVMGLPGFEPGSRTPEARMMNQVTLQPPKNKGENTVFIDFSRKSRASDLLEHFWKHRRNLAGVISFLKFCERFVHNVKGDNPCWLPFFECPIY